MVIVLQCLERYDTLAVLDPEIGSISWSSRQGFVSECPASICGVASRLDGRILCFYRHGGALHFRSDDQDFELGHTDSTQYQAIERGLAEFSILREGQPLYSWAYRRPVIDPPLELDPTPFVEEEQFDVCLFVHNVLSSPERRRRIYEKC